MKCRRLRFRFSCAVSFKTRLSKQVFSSKDEHKGENKLLNFNFSARN